MILDVLYQRITDFRKNSGLTQAQLAKKLGVTRSAVNAWEMGLSTPQVKHIAAMADIFNVTVDCLLAKENNTVVDISDLSAKEQETVINMINCLRRNNESKG